MPGLDVNRLRFVRIQGPNGPLGTGFRLSARRVLTGHHVVQGREKFWVLDPDPDDTRKWLGSQDSAAKIVWEPDGDAKAEDALDAALLETDEIEGIRPFTRILDGELPATTSWEGYGFPATGAKTPEDRQPLDGTTAGLQVGQGRFAVTVDKGLPKKEGDWKGISGAPIFARVPTFSGWTLVGVLRRTFKDLGTGRIQAIALPALLAVPEFREALELPEGRQRTSALLGSATRILRKGRIAAAVAEQHPPWKTALTTDPEGCSTLAAAICLESDLATIAGSLVDAYTRLMDREELEDASAMLDLLYCALSTSYLNGAATELPGSDATEVELRVATNILADIASAAIDGSAATLEARSAGGKLRSPYDLTEQPEGGIDPVGLQRAQDIQEALLKKLPSRLEAETPREVEKAFEYIIEIACLERPGGRGGFFSRSYLDEIGEVSGKEWRKAIAGVVNRRLEQSAEGRRYYAIVDAGTEHGKALLQQLRQHLPALRKLLRDRSREGFADRLVEEDAVVEALERAARRRERHGQADKDKETQ